MDTIAEQAGRLQREWATAARWAGITREYSARDVLWLRDSVAGECGPARRGAGELWDLLHRADAAPTLGGVVGDDAGQAAGAAGAGLQAIYAPGGEGIGRARELAPVVVDAEVGSAGLPDAFGLMTAMIEAGAAGVRLDDQRSPGATPGQRGEKVLVPTGQHIETLTAARLAADVLGVPSLIIARSGARTVSVLTSDADDRDHEFLTGERTPDGFHRVQPGLYAHVTRALAFAPYADMLWLETPAPDLAVARAFADIIRSQFPDKLLAYSCPRLFTVGERSADAPAAKFRRELAALGYRFQCACPGAGEPTSGLADRNPNDATPAYA